MAEEVGFEPTERKLNGFQDRRLRPLGHSSTFSNWNFQKAIFVTFQKKTVNKLDESNGRKVCFP
jgi:hypothetical protein